jgi:hypothetical protein
MTINTPEPSDAAQDAGVWLTRRQVAELKGVHVDTVRRWQNEFKLSTKEHPKTKEVMLSAAELCTQGLIDPTQAILPEQTIARSRTERELADARRQLAQLEAINERLADEVGFLRSLLGTDTKSAA